MMHPDLDPNRIAEDLRAQLQAYADHGTPLGDFLRAVVSNDLVVALMRADSTNISAIAAYGNYLYNHMPMLCWGSNSIYFAWVNYQKLKREGASDDQLNKAREIVEQFKHEAMRRAP
jgi:hypothetical protein